MVFERMAVVTLVLVKVQVTVSPASALKVAVAVPTLPVLLVSSQLMLVRAQPAGTVSVQGYWPGATLSVIVPLLGENAPEGVPEYGKGPVPPPLHSLPMTASRFVSLK